MSSRKRKLIQEEEEDDDDDDEVQQPKVQRTQSITSSQPQTYSTTSINEFVPGSIVRVKLINFVTYSEVEFFPGPRLNVIIGPNGSGKSSIVCAIGLGLGGGTNLLGRAKSVADFIKHGCDRAFVEIELHGERNNKNMIVRREIHKDGGGEFRVNGKAVTKTDLLAKVKELSVQVDNLCQFLPQDKVVNFAALSPVQLLEETEKAINSENMYENHMKLIEFRKQRTAFQSSFEKEVDRLEDMKKANQAAEAEVNKYKEREQLLLEVSNLKKKRYWVLFENEREKTLEARAEKEKAEAEFKKAMPERDQKKEEMVELEVAVNDSKRKRDELTKRSLSFESEISKKTKDKEHHTNQIEVYRSEIDGLNQRMESRKEEARNLTNTINQAQSQLANLPNENELKEKTDEKNKLLRDINQQMGEIQYERQTVNQTKSQLERELAGYQNELNVINNKTNVRLEKVKSFSDDAYQAYHYVQKNKNKFKRPVYGPVCLEVNVENEDHAKFLESSVPIWLLTGFVFETEEDKDLFLKELVDGQKLTLNTFFLPNRVQYRAEYNLEELKAYNITHTLDQTFTANQFVKDALMENAPLQKIAVGTNETAKYEEVIMRDTPVINLFTPQKNYTKSRSQYGERKLITRVSQVRPTKLLTGVNLQKKNELQTKIKQVSERIKEVVDRITKLNEDEDKHKTKSKGVHDERQKFQSQLDERKKLYAKINNCQKRVQALSTEEDVPTLEAKTKKKILESLKSASVATNEAVQLLVEMTKVFVERDLMVISHMHHDNTYQKAKREYDDIAAKCKDLEENLKAKVKRANDLAKSTKELRIEAEKHASSNDEALKKLLFEDMGDIETLEQIDSLIMENETKANFITGGNPRIIQEYETRKKEIEQLQEKVNNRNNSLKSMEDDMTKLKDQWLRPVKDFIAEINKRFSKFFQNIKCVGSVSLGFDETDPDDFSKYSIDIYVQFRQSETMRKLDSHTQSGGERSVATMLFLISLQELTLCPFRVVDEINQGMDQNNERMIFDQIVTTANRPGLPQYFLITPKLLENLNYGQNTAVFCVLAGPWGLNQKELNFGLSCHIDSRSQNQDDQDN